ncbi:MULTISPECIES: transglutaminaseTgpA domain-containing protein [Micrococcaceae]|uniref:transglutaminase TgpA family protein n=1 Tax=Micrococcaceae TaxID=1268 RepID=UPI001609656E|nr:MULTISPECIES: transglutaminaseTgpA domain-containing protein [Micrococcaceae]MBB5748136.1 transglutaminase-like putative cysteine protease [Micrococcus sp. TA1]HRO92532.1 transglutaminaseTgpA domain-containing protein [Citricoccus sp.]
MAGARTGLRERGLRHPRAQVGADAAVLTVLLGLGMLGFHDTFAGDPRYLTAGFGGIVLGLAVALASSSRRWGPWLTSGVVIAVYLAAGLVLATPADPAAGVLPGADAPGVLLTAPVTTWKDILTVAAPVGVHGGMLVAPYLSGLLTAVVAGLLAWRVRVPYWTLIPVLAMTVVGILFGTKDAPMALLRGMVLVMAAVVWLAWRRHRMRVHGTRTSADTTTLTHPATARRLVWRRVGLGAGVLAVAGLLTAAASPLLLQDQDRKVLRDVVEPPIELFDYPSPLMKFRQYVKDQHEEVLFTVDGLPEGQRVRLAALDAYDGMVYTVNPQASGHFSPVGDASRLSAAESPDLPNRQNGSLEITIGAYDGVWLPGGGKLTGVALSGPRAGELSRSLYYNDANETALSAIPLQSGDSYTAEVVYPVRVDPEELEDRDFATVVMPELAGVPQVVPEKAAELTGRQDSAFGIAGGLASTLHESGAFSNGREGEVTSLSGHYAGRITRLLDAEQWIGDDEQYAVAMALMARSLDIPARVVMGFYPENHPEGGGPVQIKGKDVHAWVEVNFEDIGWVAMDPTPDKDNVPTPPQQQPQSTPKPQVLQPPPPPQEQADLPPDTAPEPQDAEQEERSWWDRWGAVVMIVVYSMIPVLVLMIPLLVIALLKGRRRTRRRRADSPAGQVSGGWSEVLSLAADLGSEPQRTGTRREHAAALGAAFPTTAAGTTLLARRADHAVFGPGEPTEAQVAEYWERVDENIAGIRGSVGGWRRLRARFSPRSLVLEARARRRQRHQLRRQQRLARRAAASGRRAEERAAEPRSRPARRGGGTRAVRTVDDQASKE